MAAGNGHFWLTATATQGSERASEAAARARAQNQRASGSSASERKIEAKKKTKVDGEKCKISRPQTKCCRVDLLDPIKSKQLKKALDQLSEEGALQVFRPKTSNDQILGVVGVLQFEVARYRIENEYGVKVKLTPLPFNTARWVDCEDAKALEEFISAQAQYICLDQNNQPAILLENEWRLKYLDERFPKIAYRTTSESLNLG